MIDLFKNSGRKKIYFPQRIYRTPIVHKYFPNHDSIRVE